MITIDFTYEVITPESAKHGDFAEAGFYLGGWKFAVEDYERQVWCPMTLREFMTAAQQLGCTYWNGSWFESVDPDENYATGESTFYAMHIKGCTPSTLNRIIRYLEVNK